MLIGGTIAGRAQRHRRDGGGPNGLLIDGGTDNTVQGNYIGTDADGERPSATATASRVGGFSDDNTIGGVVPGAGNVISGNSLKASTSTTRRRQPGPRQQHRHG